MDSGTPIPKSQKLNDPPPNHKKLNALHSDQTDQEIAIKIISHDGFFVKR